MLACVPVPLLVRYVGFDPPVRQDRDAPALDGLLDGLVGDAMLGVCPLTHCRHMVIRKFSYCFPGAQE